MIEKDKVVDNISSFFNKYSGKEELEHKIDRLESHIVELELDVRTANIRYEKSTESEKKAIAAKQEAEEKLNAAEVRLKTLEHELEIQKGEEPIELSYNRIDVLNKQSAEEYLFSISSFRSSFDSLLTVRIAARESLYSVKYHDMLTERIDSETLSLAEKIDTSTGFVLFYSPDHIVNEIIVPPLPLTKSSWNSDDCFETQVLSDLLNSDAGICVLVVHAGESFVGFSFDSEKFDSSRIIKTNVKAKHGKGGFSQRRFERLRDEDIAHHIDNVTPALKGILDEFESNIDYLIIAGDLQLAKEIMKDVQTDVEQVFSSSDIRIEKHNISNILNQLLICRRYRL